MDGRLSRGSEVCRRGRSVRTIVPGAHKCSRTESEGVVLSGFPTAVEPSLRRLLPRTNPGAPPSNRRASQLLLRREDIPPPPLVVVALELCRVRLAPGGPAVRHATRDRRDSGTFRRDRRNRAAGLEPMQAVGTSTAALSRLLRFIGPDTSRTPVNHSRTTQ